MRTPSIVTDVSKYKNEYSITWLKISPTSRVFSLICSNNSIVRITPRGLRTTTSVTWSNQDIEELLSGNVYKSLI